MVSQIILVVIAFLATVLGVIGKTTNSEKKGLTHITLLGYSALILAVAACLTSIVQISAQENEKEEKKYQAFDKIKDVTNYIRSSLSIAAIFQTDENLQSTQNELRKAMDKSARDLEHITVLYKDVIPNSMLKNLNYLRDIVSNNDDVGSAKNSYTYLSYLNNAIFKVSQDLNDSSMVDISQEHPLTIFELDFPDSLKDK